MRFGIPSGVLAALVAGIPLAVAQSPADGERPAPDRGDAIRVALDTNGDHELDADEIKQASVNLAKADRNGDGRIDHEEFRPPLPPFGRPDGGFRGPPGPPRADEAAGRPAREGRPLRDGAVRGESGPRPEGGPSPERFVERALTFDADGDGKLDRAELEKFAGEMMQRMRAGMAERGMGAAGERGGGFRPGDGPRRRPGAGEDGEGGERPERPRRPE